MPLIATPTPAAASPIWRPNFLADLQDSRPLAMDFVNGQLPPFGYGTSGLVGAPSMADAHRFTRRRWVVGTVTTSRRWLTLSRLDIAEVSGDTPRPSAVHPALVRQPPVMGVRWSLSIFALARSLDLDLIAGAGLHTPGDDILASFTFSYVPWAWVHLTRVHGGLSGGVVRYPPGNGTHLTAIMSARRAAASVLSESLNRLHTAASVGQQE